MTTQRPKTSSAEDTRERLMTAAARLFAEHGFEGTSVKELADSAGVNVSLVSYHFGGKENLFRACLEHFGKQRLALAQRLLQPAASTEEFKLRLKMFVEEMFAAHAEDSDRSCIVQRESDLAMPIAEEVFRSTFLKVFETLVSFIAAGQQAGYLRADLHAEAMGSTLFGSVVNAMRSDRVAEKYFGKTIKDEQHRRSLVESIIQQHLYGIVSNNAPSESERSKQ